MEKRNIALVYDLRKDYLDMGYSEDDVAEFDSESTIASLEEAIRGLGYEVDRVGHGRALCQRLVAGERWDLVFSIAEGLKGRSREAQVPALLEMFEQPYAFSDPLVCAVTLDKEVAKKIVRQSRVPTADFVLIRPGEPVKGLPFPFPVFAKPVAEGTGKGIDGRSRVDGPGELKNTVERLINVYDQPVLVEEYLPGREFTTGILGTGGEAHALGTLEVIVKAGAPSRDYTYEVKEKCEEFVDYVRPADPEVCREVEDVALRAYLALDCRDAGRVDIRLDGEGRPNFLEVNPLPGLHPYHSDLPMIATSVGMSYRDLLGNIIENAFRRQEKGHVASSR